eukprot:3410693-Prorocentrum_lima.AAC.1
MLTLVTRTSVNLRQRGSVSTIVERRGKGALEGARPTGGKQRTRTHHKASLCSNATAARL